uniref:Uncharacterized protein n=1 Tax=Ailuropoda melanoleuca TaxID=9646 RepID=D2IE02_AILME|nr:hypothetical protein [Ailuropoda melanoleuca]
MSRQTDGIPAFLSTPERNLALDFRSSPMEGPVGRLFPHLSCRSLSESFVKYHHLAFALLWGMKGWALFHAGEEVVRGREPQSGEAGGKMGFLDENSHSWRGWAYRLTGRLTVYVQRCLNAREELVLRQESPGEPGAGHFRKRDWGCTDHWVRNATQHSKPFGSVDGQITKKILLTERVRTCTHEAEGGAGERERENLKQTSCRTRAQHEARSHNPETMTCAKIKGQMLN